ncbi:kinesin light chain 2 [Fusarium tjaetaba]|uniref:Kinesin light chain 2 n=1 Tax=Fusarium tjaetaba TaxID=1567544 RepID=A0A8H5RM69_9HYPO|nr:kinesin light chain 2 [Fusarium tjaetaba]KAF5637361.1 kinesin light chain 2 [Fusarium tjaetaba]
MERFKVNALREFDNIGQQFPGIHPPPSRNILALHEQALDGQVVVDQSHSRAPVDPACDSFIHRPQDTSTIDNMEDLRATQITPAPSMGPPRRSRKKKAPTLRDGDWEPFKDRILELYETYKLPLEKVKTMIEEEFGFTAQTRQYQSRITKWGRDKNIKKVEMAAIVRKHQQREILETDKRKLRFTVRGREVEANKIDRWMDRNNVPRNDLYAPSPAASLSDMSLALSSGGITPVAQSPMASSPALSVRGAILGRGSTFTEQSPAAPFHRALPAQLPASDTSAISPAHPPSSSILAPQEYCHGKSDEDRLRSELYAAETVFGSEDGLTLHILTALSEVLLQQGRFKSAEDMIRRVVAGYQKTVGGDNIRTLDALELLGQVLRCQGFRLQALKLLEELLETKTVALGHEHRSTLSCMVLLSKEYLSHYQWGKAALLSQRALEIRERVWGETYYSAPEIMANLGLAYMLGGRLKESKQLIEQALKSSKNHRGDEYVAPLHIMHSLLTIYVRLSDWRQAEVVAMQLFNIKMREVGEEHPDTLFVKGELATIYEGLGQLEKAKETGEQVLEVRKKILGDKHPLTLQTAGNLVRIYKKKKEYRKAEEIRVYIQLMKWGAPAGIRLG